METTTVAEQPEQVREAQISEIIGRTASELSGSLYTSLNMTTAVDGTVPDYAWWDAFRRCTKRGFEFSGLFARPITQIIAGWVMGSGISASVVDPDDDSAYTSDLATRFLARNHSLLGQVLEDEYALGDQYLVLNTDGSISVVSPDLVTPEYATFDYRTVVKYTITSRFDKYIISDIYTADLRTVRVKSSDTSIQAQVEARGFVRVKSDEFELVYDNLIGRIPIVHWHNDRGTNERRGRPIYEALYRLFERYNQMLTKMLEGAQLMGNPIPVFEGLKDTKKVIESLSTPTQQQYKDAATGQTRERRVIEWDKLPALFLGEGGRFVLVSPQGGFTEDMRAALKSLFLLVMEFTRIPDGLWGAELGSARSTLVEQMRTFEMYITSRRMALMGQGADAELGAEAAGGLLELLDIWLRIRALTDRRVQVVPLRLEFEPLSQEDQALLLDKLRWAKEMALITDETALKRTNLVPDAAAEVAAARDEQAEQGDPYDLAVNDLLTAAQQTEQPQTPTEADGEDLAA